MLLDKHKIFAKDDLKYEIIDMSEEWGGDIRIKAFSVKNQLDYVSFLDTKPTEMDVAFYLLVNSCVDENNKLIFDESDIDLLKEKKSVDAIFKIVDAILKLNKQKTSDSDELAKNS